MIAFPPELARLVFGTPVQLSRRDDPGQGSLFREEDHPRGHEGNPGQFIKKGDKPAPKHGDRARGALAKYQQLMEQARKARIDAFHELKADADAALEKAVAFTDSLNEHVSNVAWLSSPSGEWDEYTAGLFDALESNCRSLPDGPDDEELTPADHFARLGEIIATVREMQNSGNFPAEEGETPEQLAKYHQENKVRFAAIVQEARAARAALKEHAKHRKEMKAIKEGSADDLSLAAWELAALHAPKGGIVLQGKHFRGGQFIPNATLDAARKDPKDKAAVAQIDGVKGAREKRLRGGGDVDAASLKAKLADHAGTLRPAYRASVSRTWASLKDHHGALALHRLRELAEADLAALASGKTKGADGHDLTQRLAGYAAMLEMAEAGGYAAETMPKVEKPTKPAGKELWEMTREEYEGPGGGRGFAKGNYDAEIETALEDGKPVPRGIALEFDTIAAKHQPHLLTAKEFRQATGRDSILSSAGPRARDKANEEHRAAVESALAAGRPVPPEVLADYPELQKSPPPDIDSKSGAAYTSPGGVNKANGGGGEGKVVELPKLTGSEKQVTWAETIRAESLPKVERKLDEEIASEEASVRSAEETHQRTGGESWLRTADRRRQRVAELRARREAVLAMLRSEKVASRWIDHRANLIGHAENSLAIKHGEDWLEKLLTTPRPQPSAEHRTAEPSGEKGREGGTMTRRELATKVGGLLAATPYNVEVRERKDGTAEIVLQESEYSRKRGRHWTDVGAASIGADGALSLDRDFERALAERHGELLASLKSLPPATSPDAPKPPSVTFDARASKHGALGAKTYLAKIKGPHLKYGFDRAFIDPDEVSGRDHTFTAATEGVYELQDGSGRQYFRVKSENGTLTKEPLTLEEAKALHPVPAAWAEIKKTPDRRRDQGPPDDPLERLEWEQQHRNPDPLELG